MPKKSVSASTIEVKSTSSQLDPDFKDLHPVHIKWLITHEETKRVQAYFSDFLLKLGIDGRNLRDKSLQHLVK